MMTTFGTGRDVPSEQVIRLWQSCFGDDEAYIRFFLRTACQPEDCLTITAAGQLAAMLFLLPGSIGKVTGRYVFAVATAPDFRGQGLSSQLLERAVQLAANRGEGFLALVPAEQSLFDFYGKRGFSTAFRVRETEVEGWSEAGRQISLTAEQLLRLRDDYFAQSGCYFRWGERELAWHLEETEFTGGRVVALELDGLPGYALAVPDGNRGWFLKEAAFGGDLQRFLRCVRFQLGNKPVRARLWVGADTAGHERDFGMIRPVAPQWTPAAESGYIGLVLD